MDYEPAANQDERLYVEAEQLGDIAISALCAHRDVDEREASEFAIRAINTPGADTADRLWVFEISDTAGQSYMIALRDASEISVYRFEAAYECMPESALAS